MHMFFTPPFIELYGNSDNDNLDIEKNRRLNYPTYNQSEFAEHLLDLMYIQRNSVITNSVFNVHSVITNSFRSQLGHFSTQINPVITNPGYNEQKRPVPCCSL